MEEFEQREKQIKTINESKKKNENGICFLFKHKKMEEAQPFDFKCIEPNISFPFLGLSRMNF